MSENLEQTPNVNPRSEVAEKIETTAPNNSENNPSEQPSEPAAAPATEPAVDPMNDPRFEAPRAQRFPTWGDMLAVIGIYLLATVGTSIVVAIIAAVSGGTENFAETMSNGPMSALSYALSMGLTIVGVLIYRKLRRGAGRMFHFSLRGFNPMLILWGFVMVLLTGVVIEPVLELFPDAFLKMIDKMGMHGGWSILMLVVLAPVMEEVLFRGILLESVRSKHSAGRAIVVSALMFGVIHFIPQQVVNAFVIGLILGYIYVRTESLWPVIVIHALNNAMAYVIMQWSDGANITVRSLIDNNTVYAVVYGVSLAALVASGYMVWRSIEKINAGSPRA
ncbi:MAG: CPBP family intramembrane metalloprotease [Rikenellaceae bacterium]|nr:CPBP family intramembrane metalloprotease [Rikenellaceae bacterium]